jgi:CubicO group peptidase (beta-lactamase class C family)
MAGVGTNIQELVEEYVNNKDFSGTVLVKQGDNIIFEGAYGYAHKGFKVPNNINTRFDTASITKLFTAAAVFQLIDNKKLSFNDKILDILDLKDTTISKEVTIYHLLNHTSGIGDDADEEAGEDYEDIWKQKPNYMVRETEDFLPQFIYKTPNFMPGKGHRYCNVAYVLLGLAIEKVTGLKYRDYIIENIFKPAEMMNTEFCSMDGIFENVAEGYSKVEDGNGDFLGWRKNIYSYPPIGSPDAGVYTTVKDLDKFIRALRSEKLLSSAMTKEIFNIQMLVRELELFNQMECYGFGALQSKEGETICYYKTGVNAGVANMFSYYPKQDATVVLLANQTCNVWALNREIHKTVMDNL